MNKTRLFFVLLLLCFVSVGCGMPRTQVTGKVVFDDGSPLTAGEIRGKSDAVEIRGKIGSDGSFELFETKPGDGVPSGITYTIWISNTDERIPSKEKIRDPEGNMISGEDTFVSRIDNEYKSSQKTPLTLTLERGVKISNIDFTVKKPSW